MTDLVTWQGLFLAVLGVVAFIAAYRGGRRRTGGSAALQPVRVRVHERGRRP